MMMQEMQVFIRIEAFVRVSLRVNSPTVAHLCTHEKHPLSPVMQLHCQAIVSDRKIFLTGLVNSLFEGSMCDIRTI